MNALKRRVYISLLILTVLVSSATTCLVMRRAPTTALPAHSEVVAAQAEDPVERFRTEREQLRQQQKGELNDIIYNPSSDSETISMAQRQLVSLMDAEAKELAIEGILESRGYENVLAVVSEQSANLLIRRDEALTQRESAVILELVMRETGIVGGNVKIIPVK